MTNEHPLQLPPGNDLHISNNSQWQTEADRVILQWWNQRQHDLPRFSELARTVFSVSPSSAPVERVFSIYEALYGTRQFCLEDHVETSVMLRANRDHIDILKYT